MPSNLLYGGWATHSPTGSSYGEYVDMYRREMQRRADALRVHNEIDRATRERMQRMVDPQVVRVNCLEPRDPFPVPWEDELSACVPQPVSSTKIRKVTPLSTLAEKEKEICNK